jgi:hypothetical protein
MAYAANLYPVAMKAAQTSETRSLNQVVQGTSQAGLGDLSFDGTGLLGSGLFGQATWGLPEWGVLLAGGLMVAKMFFGGSRSGGSGRRRQLQLAKAKYELERAQA